MADYVSARKIALRWEDGEVLVDGPWPKKVFFDLVWLNHYDGLRIRRVGPDRIQVSVDNGEATYQLHHGLGGAAQLVESSLDVEDAGA